MYATNEERVEMARVAWAQADAAQRALSRKLQAAERKASKLDGMAYAAACSEAALIRTQYAAVVELASSRWTHFQTLAEDALVA